MDLHVDTIGLAHTHPWLYWGAFVKDENGHIVRPDASGVILSANVVEELAIMWKSGTRPQQRDKGFGDTSATRVGILFELHDMISTNIHNSILQPLPDRRFGVAKEQCQPSSLSIKGLSTGELVTMVAAVRAGVSILGHHPCDALSTLSQDIVEELEVRVVS